MNEDLIKRLVKIKLDLADSFIARLPEKEEKQLREIGHYVLEALNEQNNVSGNMKNTKESSNIKEINIE
ncbi:MAG: hypothetical protein WCF96_08405 [Eubacteriales bacterium]